MNRIPKEVKLYYISGEDKDGKEFEYEYENYIEADTQFERMYNEATHRYCVMGSYWLNTRTQDIYDKAEICGFEIHNNGEMEEW